MSDNLFGFDPDKQWDYENGFHITSHQTRLAKILAHYELYKSILKLPGHIVECGVFKGASFLQFATFRESLENPFSRKLVGFDAFGKFPTPRGLKDQKFVEKFEQDAGDGLSKKELTKIMTYKGFQNYELISGDIIKTVPDYAKKSPELKISLLHIDVDVYQPSKVILDHLFDQVVSGGLVVFDDYGTVAGETRAIDEFFLDTDIKVEKLPISHIPAFVRK